MTYLPDVNVWLALSVGDHIHHVAAAQWFAGTSGDTLVLCRVTQMGLLRLLTNSSVMASSALTPAQAWNAIEALRGDSRIVFRAEPSALEYAWRNETRRHRSGSNFWTDAYLAAFASASGATLVSFDRGFGKRDVETRILNGNS